jgi:hypothetical protein
MRFPEGRSQKVGQKTCQISQIHPRNVRVFTMNSRCAATLSWNQIPDQGQRGATAHIPSVGRTVEGVGSCPPPLIGREQRMVRWQTWVTIG